MDTPCRGVILAGSERRLRACQAHGHCRLARPQGRHHQCPVRPCDAATPRHCAVARPDRSRALAHRRHVVGRPLEPLLAVLAELGPTAPDDAYLAHSRWHEVARAATGAHRLMAGSN
ncbi:SCO4402 family protein [Micromonospora echinospora]